MSGGHGYEYHHDVSQIEVGCGIPQRHHEGNKAYYPIRDKRSSRATQHFQISGLDWTEQGLGSALVCYENFEDTQLGSKLHRIKPSWFPSYVAGMKVEAQTP